MGVTWSQPKPVAEATKIMFKASFPKTQKLRAQLWNLWKHYKQSLKQDGFAVSCYRKHWSIFYFTNVTSNTYTKIDTPDGPTPTYMVEFKQKYAEWKEILDELNTIDHIGDAPDEEPWYFDMENDKASDD